jgi:hypothetical protein
MLKSNKQTNKQKTLPQTQNCHGAGEECFLFEQTVDGYLKTTKGRIEGGYSVYCRLNTILIIWLKT